MLARLPRRGVIASAQVAALSHPFRHSHLDIRQLRSLFPFLPSTIHYRLPPLPSRWQITISYRRHLLFKFQISISISVPTLRAPNMA